MLLSLKKMCEVDLLCLRLATMRFWLRGAGSEFRAEYDHNDVEISESALDDLADSAVVAIGIEYV